MHQIVKKADVCAHPHRLGDLNENRDILNIIHYTSLSQHTLCMLVEVRMRGHLVVRRHSPRVGGAWIVRHPLMRRKESGWIVRGRAPQTIPEFHGRVHVWVVVVVGRVHSWMMWVAPWPHRRVHVSIGHSPWTAGGNGTTVHAVRTTIAWGIGMGMGHGSFIGRI